MFATPMAEMSEVCSIDSRGAAENPSRSENCEEVQDVAPEGRRRSGATSRTYGAEDCASIAICSREGVSGRASSGCVSPTLLRERVGPVRPR